MRLASVLIAGLFLMLPLHSITSWSQQSNAPYSTSVGEQAVKVVFKSYRLIKDTKKFKGLPQTGDWTIGKMAPTACPVSQHICVEVFYRVPSLSVQCSWLVLMNADGTDPRFLDENDDTERYFMRKLTTAEADARSKSRGTPVYPPIAKAAHVSGQVLVDVIVDKTGKVPDSNMASSPEMLRGATLDVARWCVFDPLMVGTRAIKFETQLVFLFGPS